LSQINLSGGSNEDFGVIGDHLVSSIFRAETVLDFIGVCAMKFRQALVFGVAGYHVLKGDRVIGFVCRCTHGWRYAPAIGYPKIDGFLKTRRAWAIVLDRQFREVEEVA
jgi:hypothetical protein